VTDTQYPKPVRCSFYARTPADGGGWYYDRIDISGYQGKGYVVTNWPPAVGDSLFLDDQSNRERSGNYRVVERSWMHSSWGSPDWPYNETGPRVGPMLDCIVELYDGPFVDEVTRTEDESDD
jgi:hypothetical protein